MENDFATARAHGCHACNLQAMDWLSCSLQTLFRVPLLLPGPAPSRPFGEIAAWAFEKLEQFCRVPQVLLPLPNTTCIYSSICSPGPDTT